MRARSSDVAVRVGPGPDAELAPTSATAQAPASVPAWNEGVARQVAIWQHTARVHSSMNELAALHFRRLHEVSVVVISVLTVVVGGDSLATVFEADVEWVRVLTGLCGILLGMASLLSTNLEWKGRASAYKRRAQGYSRLSLDLRIQRVKPAERMDVNELFESVPARIEALDDLADPLPLTYRKRGLRMAGSGAMWGADSTRALGDADDPQVVAGLYDPADDFEGDFSALDPHVQLMLTQTF